MRPIARLALEKHTGPYEKWPLKSRLVIDGALSEHRIPGFVIDAQYETEFGLLVITSYDCLFEESNSFSLLDASFRIVASASLGAPYASFLLDEHWPVDASTLALHYYQDDFFTLHIAPPGGFWRRRPRLVLRRYLDWRSNARMVESSERMHAQLDDIRRGLEKDAQAERERP